MPADLDPEAIPPLPPHTGGGSRNRFNFLYETLRDRICLLDYPPGTRLSEEKLAAEFGISRTPLRRVLFWLEAQGLLQSVHGVGTIVSDTDIDKLTQVYALRMELSTLLGVLSPMPVEPETVAIFERLHHRAQRAGKETEIRTLARLHLDLFHAVMRLSGNKPLREASERLFYQTSRIWLEALPHMDVDAEIMHLQNEISELLAAVQIGDLQAASHIRRAHLSMNFNRLKTLATALSEESSKST